MIDTLKLDALTDDDRAYIAEGFTSVLGYEQRTMLMGKRWNTYDLAELKTIARAAIIEKLESLAIPTVTMGEPAARKPRKRSR